MPVLFISAALTLILSLSSTGSVDISCREPPTIQFASISGVTDEGFSLGSIVTYTCQFGYAFKGENNILQCVQSETEREAEWTEPHFSCSPQSCGDPGYINNGRRVGSLFTFPHSVSYKCDDGYKFSGLAIRYCQASGSWSGRLPTCQMVTCNVPKDLDNGHVTYSSLEYGSELKYKCDKGFRLNTDETVFCTVQGHWSRTDVECAESVCDIPLKPEHGSMQVGGTGGKKPRTGSIAIFSCEGDRIPDGPTTSKCLENGQWTFPTPKCIEPCSIPYITTGVIGKYEQRSRWNRQKVFKQLQMGIRSKEGEEVILRCHEGYEASGSDKRENKIVCRQGRWSNEPHCEPAFCRLKPPYFANAEIVTVNPEHGGSISYRCLADFRKIENEVIVCNFGEWTGTPPTCKDTRCSLDMLDFPGLLKAPKSSYRDGESFEIVCDARYRITKERQFKCEDGIWIGPSQPCVAANCTKPPPGISHARAEILSVEHNSMVNYVCEDPYILEESSQVQCLFGEWKGLLPRCKDSRCYLEKLEKSSHVATQSSQVTSSGNQMDVICTEGFSPSGEIPYCLNGKWTRNSISPCTENSCSVPTLYNGDVVEEKLGNWYLNSRLRFVRDVTFIKIRPGKIVHPGTSYLLKCHNGYSFQGTSIGRTGITCMKGKWHPDPVCLIIGTRYVPKSAVPGISVSSMVRKIQISNENTNSTVTTKTTSTTTLPTSTRITNPEAEPFDLGQTTSEETTSTTDSAPVVEECFCEYPIDDENLVASVDGERLGFLDKVKNASLVVFRCEHVGFHRFSGPREIKCENCQSWHSSAFPSCTDPKRGDAVIFSDRRLSVSVEGNLEIRKGQNLELKCAAVESDMYPKWSTPTNDRISITLERKERESYGDVLYISNLQIEKADFENEGLYKCAVANNTDTVINIAVIDPNVQCPAFQEEDEISITYNMERHVKGKASFSCLNQNQELVGKAVLTCLKTGEWSDPPPHCQDIKCKEIEGTDMLQILYTGDRGIGSMATFHCPNPTKRSGVSFASCLKNGTWSDPTPICISPPCFSNDLFSALPENVVPDMDSLTNTTFPYNTTFRITCIEELIAVGNTVVKCGKNGTWEFPIIQCLSGCPSPEKQPKSKLNIQPEKDVYMLGEATTFSCPPGMKLNTDLQLIMCMKNGWSETILPECEEGEDFMYEAEAQTNDQTDSS